MRYMKYGLIGLAVVLLLVGAVFGYIVATFDPNAYKEDIALMVSENTGRTLTFEGDLELTLFPKIGVSAAGVSLSEQDSESEFAGLDDLRVALALLPLLSGNIIVDEVILDGLRATLIKHANGAMNVDDLMSMGQRDQESTKQPDPGTQDANRDVEQNTDAGVADDGPTVTLDVQGVRITNGALTWRDESAGTAYDLTELTIETGHVSVGKPIKFDWQAKVRSEQPMLDLRTRAKGTFTANMLDQRFIIDALDVRVEGDAGTLSALDVTLAANVEAQPTNEWIGLTDLKIEASATSGNDRHNSRLVVASLVIEKETVSTDQLTAAFKSQLSSTTDTDEGVSDVNAEADIRLSGLSISPDTLAIAEVAIDLNASQGESALKGRLTTALRGDLAQQDFQLPKLSGQFQVQSPELPMKSTTIPITGGIEANLEREQIDANLRIRFDQSDIEGVFEVKGFADAFFGFDVGIDKIDLDRYRSPGGSRDKESAPDDTQAGTDTADTDTAEAPFDLSPLKALNLAGELRIGTLIASGVTFSDVRFKVNAAKGNLAVNPFFARLYRGSTRGVVTVDANSNRFGVRQTMSNVSVGPLLRDLFDQDLLDGRGAIELDLSAQGDTVDALKRTLTGDASIALKNGAVKGINLAQTMRNAGDLLTAKRNHETTAVSTRKTDFSDLDASFVIEQGKARNDDLALRSPFIRLDGKGDIDIVDAGLDYLANLSVVATSSGQGGKALADVAGLTIPVRISGPIDSLRYELKFSNALADQAKQRVKEEQKKLEEKLESELMEKLFDETSPATPAGNGAGEPEAPNIDPEDVLKDRLKKLLR